MLVSEPSSGAQLEDSFFLSSAHIQLHQNPAPLFPSSLSPNLLTFISTLEGSLSTHTKSSSDLQKQFSISCNSSSWGTKTTTGIEFCHVKCPHYWGYICQLVILVLFIWIEKMVFRYTRVNFVQLHFPWLPTTWPEIQFLESGGQSCETLNSDSEGAAVLWFVLLTLIDWWLLGGAVPPMGPVRELPCICLDRALQSGGKYWSTVHSSTSQHKHIKGRKWSFDWRFISTWGLTSEDYWK